MTIDTTGTKKVWVEIDQAKVDVGSSNNADGTGIGYVETGASYPADSYIPLASISSGTITDEREILKLKPRRTNLGAWKVIVSNGDGVEVEIGFGSDTEVLTSNGPTALPSFEPPNVYIS